MKTTTMNRWLGLVVTGLALAAAACDPYEEPSDANPAVIRVSVVDATFSQADPVLTEAPDPLDDVWRIADLASPQAPSNHRVVAVTTNKLLDGSSIQATTANCEVAAGAFDFANAPLTPGATWYACYYPSSASASWGASILFYQAPQHPDPLVVDENRRPGRGVLDYDTTYAIAGSVRDAQGKLLDFELEFTTGPMPAPSTPTFPAANITDTGVRVTWGAVFGTQTWTVERADDLAGAPDPGTWATVASFSAIPVPPATSVPRQYNDTGLTPATTYWYRVTATSWTYSTTSAAASVTTLP